MPILTTAPDFIKEGYPAWAYFCCHPQGRYAQRLLDTPLLKTRMFGWLFYRTHAQGFLHWGYNYWYRSQTRELIDPFFVSDGGRWPDWSYGDSFLVYPGTGAPIDSLRWEVFTERPAGLRAPAKRSHRSGRPATGGDQGLRGVSAAASSGCSSAGEGAGEVGSEVGDHASMTRVAHSTTPSAM